MNSLPVLTYPCPSGEFGEDHYVVVVGLAPEGGVVFVRSSEPGRSWEFPGGAVERGETVIEAAIREFEEETGWKLEEPVEAARICNGTTLHGLGDASLVAGFVARVDSPFNKERANEPGIAQCALFARLPHETTFAPEWLARLRKTALERLAATANRALWSKAAADYDDATVIAEDDVHYGPLIPGESTLRLLPPLSGASVLDLGCGAGHNLAALRRLGVVQGHGIDFSPEQVRRARQRLCEWPEFHVEEDDLVTALTKRQSHYDLALSVFALPFVADPARLVRLACACLRPGGTLVLSTNHPVRLGCSVRDQSNNENWYPSRARARTWLHGDGRSSAYVHWLHDLPTLVAAVTGAGLRLEEILEPPALPEDELDHAPYRSPYYVRRHHELFRMPYTVILRAVKPTS